MSDDLADGPLSGRALLIEDNAIVALDTQDMLGAMGFDPIDIAASVAEALVLMQAHSYSAAVVDLVVKDGSSRPAMDQLIKAGVPFVIASGYVNDGTAAPALKSAPQITKPYDEALLRAALVEARRQASRGR